MDLCNGPETPDERRPRLIRFSCQLPPVDESTLQRVNILVSVNYSRVYSEPSAPGGGLFDGTSFLLLETKVYLGMTKSINDVVANTPPIHLVPGTHVYGVSVFSMRETFSNHPMAAIGIAQVGVHKFFQHRLGLPDHRSILNSIAASWLPT